MLSVLADELTFIRHFLSVNFFYVFHKDLRTDLEKKKSTDIKTYARLNKHLPNSVGLVVAACNNTQRVIFLYASLSLLLTISILILGLFNLLCKSPAL